MPNSVQSNQVTRTIRARVTRGGERLWRIADFNGYPVQAVAQAFSRLYRAGELQRLSKGVYYRARPTVFGTSRANPADLPRLMKGRHRVFPSGVAAAQLLGLSTQTARLPEVATSAPSLPRKLFGKDAIIHTRRPAAWANLDETDAALLDVLRRRGETSELAPQETIKVIADRLKEDQRFARLARVAESEPPRVRAMLGAFGEDIGVGRALIERLRSSLNPLSRFDFGVFTTLRHAREWQAKDNARHAAL